MGLYLIIDENQLMNIPRFSARLEASTEMFPVVAEDEIFDSSSQVAVVPSNDPDAEPLMSDEGILFMDSAEGEIMDSQELEFIHDSGESQQDLIRKELDELDDSQQGGLDSDAITMDDVMKGED